jgi:RNA polymerase sigma-70 factor (ECF subfamily)
VGFSEQQVSGARRFVTTQWELVLSAGRTTTTESRDALEELCKTYWYPLYAFVRRRGYPPEEAQDLTQQFFERLLETNFLQNADPGKGRFRTFLLTVLERFLVNEWTKAHRQKRGGNSRVFSLDDASAEARYQLEPHDDATPEVLFERKWALALLRQALEGLQAECSAAGRGALFEEVKSVLAGDSETVAYSEIAQRLGMTEGAVKAAVYRWRRRYSELVRSEVARTVAAPEDVQDEIRHLSQAFVR